MEDHSLLTQSTLIILKAESLKKKKLHIVERQISFPGITNPILFLVSGDTEEYMQNVKKFNDTLLVTLVVLGVGLMIAVFLQVNYGLLPLNKIKQALFKIRNGDKKIRSPIST